FGDRSVLAPRSEFARQGRRDSSMTSHGFPDGNLQSSKSGLQRLLRFVGIGLMLVLTGGFGDQSRGGTPQHDDHALGKVDFPISCSKQAQEEFNRAVALLHHMTYPQSREAFERVATIDSKCAMAHWGIAMTLFQPLWPTRPRPDALRRGWEEAQKAKSLLPPTE